MAASLDGTLAEFGCGFALQLEASPAVAGDIAPAGGETGAPDGQHSESRTVCDAARLQFSRTALAAVNVGESGREELDADGANACVIACRNAPLAAVADYASFEIGRAAIEGGEPCVRVRFDDGPLDLREARVAQFDAVQSVVRDAAVEQPES